jgi:CBS domain-containing protein
MKKDEPIKTIMTKDLITINLSNSLYTAEKRLKTYNVRHMPVVDGHKLIGLVSLSDLKRLSFLDAYSIEGTEDTAIYNMLSIEDVMIKNPVTVSSNTPIIEVAELLAHKKFHSLPIVDKGTLVGIITTTDLLNYFIASA